MLNQKERSNHYLCRLIYEFSLKTGALSKRLHVTDQCFVSIADAKIGSFLE